MASRFTITYRIASDAASIEARAQAVAVEQSVEMPVSAIAEPEIVRDIVGQVEAIAPAGDHVFDVRIGLATATVGDDAAQFLNMLFGNTSLHTDVVLLDVDVPAELVAAFGGPRHGIEGLRRRVGAFGRALTCSALKPQGVSPLRLAELAGQFARGGIDFIKDDHGLADQRYSPAADRIVAVADAVGATRYLPSLSGDLDAMRRQIELAQRHGVDTVMIAPMLAGWATMQTLVRQYPDVAFFAHPTMGGAARVAPDLLIGKLFRLLGADAVIFPNHGGRFGYSPATCRSLAGNARGAWHAVRPSVPVPAGGMTLERVPELLDFYGPDAMLLIGGSLLAARERLTQETAAFARAVAQHSYR
ncbi:MAG TPA: RuBisCO large subunit C-terminal-like domain-containing protein [Acetobacteraceae bacterium]|nr:RuBisCO large subunit C-terminal-like domain-containing protein [Acetobacteraceae bacterium]